MKAPGKAIVMLLLLALFSGVTMAHAEDLGVWEELGIPDPSTVLLWGAAIGGFFIVASLYYRRSMGEGVKKMSFTLIAVPVALSTLYLAGATVYLNQQSATGGPVHWHADYEVWACGEKHELVDPTGLENRIGPPLIHEHNDNRIHVEGVLLELEDASLHEFFEAVGGEFTGDMLAMPTNDGLMTWINGELCSGQPAQWYVFVNGQLVENGHEHIIAPYPVVPPGDRIKIVFSEKQPGSINTEFFEAP
jgi:hypothetical protein